MNATGGDAIYPSLRDRAVFITGGGTGIGAAMVSHFCAQGAAVGFADIAAEASEALVAEIADAGHAAPRFWACDLTDTGALHRMLAEAQADLGPIRALVNNAANDDRHRLEDVTEAYWDQRMAVNLRHQFFAVQAVRKGMAEAGGGSIINLGSTSWMAHFGGMPCYTTAKAAIHGLSRGLAEDLGSDNIRVNVVAPGWVMTERQKRLWATETDLAAMMARQCLKQTLEPADVARLVLWLAADDSRTCTAQTFIVDAGFV